MHGGLQLSQKHKTDGHIANNALIGKGVQIVYNFKIRIGNNMFKYKRRISVFRGLLKVFTVMHNKRQISNATFMRKILVYYHHEEEQ